MKEIVILSGKGGTGKTSVVAALAHLAAETHALVLADADGDAANLELVLAPHRVYTVPFSGGEMAVIAQEKCVTCGRCAEVCRFAAIRSDDTYRVDEIACEGCAACYYQCPADAIRMESRQDGEWYRSETHFGLLFHAHLFAGRENSGKLVTAVKQAARQAAGETQADLLLVDGPPGIGCPVIAATSGADLALLVTEPSVSGIHDLERILATTHFRVPALVCINKADLNPRRTAEVEASCAAENVPVVGRIPFDSEVTAAMVRGQPVTARDNTPASVELRRSWQRLQTNHL